MSRHQEDNSTVASPLRRQGFANNLTQYGDREFSAYLRRAFAKSLGYTENSLNKAIVGICYTESGFNNCHRHFPELLRAVERGVLAAGALPISFPVISLGEIFLSPTSMKYRNLMAMDTEEMIRAQPMDSVVLMGGCDKTLPALLMGAISADKPAVLLAAGPMLTGRYKQQKLGACTDCRHFWKAYRSGALTADELSHIENQLVVTAGTCAVMGTASTMALLAETLGMALPHSAAVPAVYAERLRLAETTGTQAVQLIGSGRTPKTIITEASIENALRVLQAVSGSTNALIHLAAIAGRLGLDIDYDRFNVLADSTPVLVNLKPVGKYYMEDFAAAGALEGVLRTLRAQLNLDTHSVTGESLRTRLAKPLLEPINRELIRDLKNPIAAQGGLIFLQGSLAPGGAVLKRAAASAHLLEHEGRAVVFSSLEDLAARIDDPQLDVRADDILVLQNAGPAHVLPCPKQVTCQSRRNWQPRVLPICCAFPMRA